MESVVRTTPLTARYVAGEGADQAVAAAAGVVADGLLVSLDHLGGEARDAAQAARAVEAHLGLLDGLARRGVAKGADISLRLSGLGLRFDEKLAKDNAARVCQAAEEAGAGVTLDAEEAPLAEAALRLHSQLLEEHSSVGVEIQSSWRRAEEYCRSLASARVRLSRGLIGGPAPVSYQEPEDVDRSYVRCLKALMTAGGYLTVATHDRRLVEIASALAVLNEREPGGFEYQMAYGVRRPEQRRLAHDGARVRVRIPYGADWYAQLTRRVAERPANLTLLARSLVGR
ncbi:proline dehydrogenase family protein [Sphaerisporangium fuscum]|uniref:proline dehydrogenase family protein n=1 Tax=Sphaerisporangium fuscum TaxID=2835868 RepID=UPI0027E23A74|nr:proline dehydrogenase family protein [Sphaerisporangium fuscum]